MSRTITLGTPSVEWALAWDSERGLATTRVTNLRTGTSFAPSPCTELALLLSARADRLEEPCRRVDDFIVRDARQDGANAARFILESASSRIEAELFIQLEGGVRRKSALLRNQGTEALLVLDIVLDDLGLGGRAIEEGASGQGQPLFIDNELWAAIEHPSGWNQVNEGRMQLSHCPGARLDPGASLQSSASLIAAAPAGAACADFIAWIQERCLRLRRKTASIYTPFGINNQWGLCSTLDDEQTLHVLATLEGFKTKGASFDYFSLDTGWVDYGSDLTRFRPIAYPEGPAEVIGKVEELGMRFGLWFATSWASQSCWDYPPAWGDNPPPALLWRNGHAAMTDYAGSFCLAAPPYFSLLKSAVLHHVRNNGVRLLKFDGGNYRCDDPAHSHLPGTYAVERMHGMLIELAAAARAEAPDVFIMWYWGLRSPFWALHGDTIFESGLFMEGSGTSAFPTLHYRDSVTLAQDQNAWHARTIPPVAKDSLGVWLADTRWGNYMGRERWREAMIMDLARGNLLVPNLWGDIYLLEPDDLGFLARVRGWAQEYEDLLLRPRATIGDPMKGEAYGYAYFDGDRGLVFLNNPCFISAQLEVPLPAGLAEAGPAGFAVRVLFPEPAASFKVDGEAPRAGHPLAVWVRPFEALMMEVRPAAATDTSSARLAIRELGTEEVGRLGVALDLQPAQPEADLEVNFADAARFSAQGHRQQVFGFAASLPSLEGPLTPILCIAIQLRHGKKPWKYSPAVAEIVQATARIGAERVHFVPVPDARQFGNTQKAGCSWVVYKTRMPRRWAGRVLRLGVHAFAPPDVEAVVQAWVVRRWWNESARPVGDGYYADAPS
jgi:hypothetical protein